MAASNHAGPIKLGAFLLSFFCLGVPYWLQPYADLTLPNALFGPGLLPMFFAAVYLKAGLNSVVSDVLLLTGAVAPAVVLIRKVIEAILLPETHNLWPFEMIIAGLLGLIVSGMGLLLGSLIRRLLTES